MTKYSDEFALQIRSESKYMTWKALSLKHKLSSNQVNYLLHKKRLTITTTTWLGSNAENVLLSACLYEGSSFLKAPETVSLYKSQFDEAVQLMQQEMLRDYASEYNGGI